MDPTDPTDTPPTWNMSTSGPDPEPRMPYTMNSAVDNKLVAPASAPFWSDSPSVLYEPRSNLLDFFPTPTNPTSNANLNALTRFFLYLGIIVALGRRRGKEFFVIAITAAIIIYLVHEYTAPAENLEPALQGCRVPTRDNPSMNVAAVNWNTRNDLMDACDITNPAVKAAQTEALFDPVYALADDPLAAQAYASYGFHPVAGGTTIPDGRDMLAGIVAASNIKGRGGSCKLNNSCNFISQPSYQM